MADVADEHHQPSLIHLLHRASRSADRLFMRSMSDLGLTYRDFATLQAVAADDGLSQTGIMATTGFERSSTAELVGRLVRNGLLTRRRSRRDTRLYVVRLTPQGRAVLTRATPRAHEAELRVSELVALPSKEDLFESLSRLVQAE